MTPEQFKALGLKEGDPIHLTIKGQVTNVQDPAEYRHPVRLVGPSGSIFWAALDDVEKIDVLEAPLKVGDRVTWGIGQAVYTIVHIDEGRQQAALHDGQWGYNVKVLGKLRRADA